MREQFTFYRSFFDAIRRIRKKADKADAYDALCDYALYGTEPDLSALPDAAAIAFELIRPNLDAAKRKADGGKKGREPKDTAESCERYAEDTDKIAVRYPQDTANKKEGEKEKEKEKEREYECISPLYLPLMSGTHAITEEDVAKYKALYPSVDVEQELRNMAGWLDGNPKRRKTAGGIERFIHSWLKRAQGEAHVDFMDLE